SIQLEQQPATNAQAVVDSETSVEIRIVDESFPADGCARLFEIHAHHNKKVRSETVLLRFQLTRVLQRSFRVVNRAWSDDDEQTVVGSVQNTMYGLARLRRNFRGG